jgi:hypothetical protein
LRLAYSAEKHRRAASSRAVSRPRPATFTERHAYGGARVAPFAPFAPTYGDTNARFAFAIRGTDPWSSSFAPRVVIVVVARRRRGRRVASRRDSSSSSTTVARRASRASRRATRDRVVRDVRDAAPAI